jgi:deoxyribodipyrimidine photolyase-related protein
MMKNVGLIFPHQLMEDTGVFNACDEVYLVEECLFFRQFSFHKRKLAYHRATMKQYESFLQENGFSVRYIDTSDERSDIRTLIQGFSTEGISVVHYIDPTDNWLEKRLKSSAKAFHVSLEKHPSPLFLNESDDFAPFSTRKKLFQTEFYKAQRIQRNFLMDADGGPKGGKWSFDEDNRKRYPKGLKPPVVETPKKSIFDEEAIQYVDEHFPLNPGSLKDSWHYPSSFEESKRFLNAFFETRFAEFGTYEDAILKKELVLNHSVISPMLNIGLLTPQFVVDEAIRYAAEHDVPMNSLEGFVRQIVGWREFIRMVYELKGSEERTRNYWGFTRKIPASFWKGNTGIPPIDETINKVLETGYCHHIERLMVLGNFMLLCEFDPDEVYRWFMELFIDAYDWVMVPNIYGMSQFADGGLMSTKPYISGSNYLMKMSDYEKGEWQATWDGLFWRFMDKQRSFFLSNPRIGMLVHSFDKMTEDKKRSHLNAAESYLQRIDAELEIEQNY